MTAGENALVCLYNGQPGEKLDILRLQRFCQNVSTSTVRVEPHTLPQHQHLQRNIAYGCMLRFSSGKELAWMSMVGDGLPVTREWFPL